MTTNPRTNRRSRSSLRIIFAAVLALWLTAPLRAQAQAGSLVVNVRDPSGAAVVGATVTLTRADTNEAVGQQTTNDEGVARFPNLAPGRYNVVAEVTGFNRFEQRGVEVEVGPEKLLDLPLVLSPAAEEVTVSGGPGGRAAELSALPNLNNDLTPLLQVVPGAVATGPSTLGKVVIDGKGKDQQTVRLDGVDATPLVELPSGDSALDVLSSFQKPEVAFDLDNSNPTQSRAFAPRFGPGTGSVVDGLSFSGTNTWRAQLYGEHRNGAVNARSFFDAGKNPLRRSRYGGRAGGPLTGNEDLFFYLGYDGVRGRTERDVDEAVPVEAACDCGTGPVAPFLRGFLPVGTVLAPVVSLNPDFLVARRRVRETAESDTWDARLDLRPSESLSPTFRFTRLAAQNLVPDGVTGRLQRQRVVFHNALAQLLITKGGASHDIKFSLNETSARVGVEFPPSAGPALRQELITIGGTVRAVGQPNPVPVASLGGVLKGSTGRGYGLTPISYNVSYDYTRPVRFLGASHDLFFGVETRLIRLTFDKFGGVTYAFPDAAALRSGAPGRVTFLSDLSAPSPFGGGAGARHAAQNYYMGYFQLSSEVRQNLTLTYGLRYDYFGAVRERDNRAVVVDPGTGDILPTGAPFYRASKSNFQPRFGLALKSDEEGLIRNMTFRVGAGFYSGVPRIGDLLLPIESDRFSTGVTGGTFPSDPAEVARGFVESPQTRQFQPVAFARDFTTPERAYKWEASLARTLGGLYDLKLVYAGNVGRNLPLAGVANQITGVVANPDPTKPATVVRQFDIVRDNLVFKPFGEFFFRSSVGRSSYNGLTVQLLRNTTSAADTNTDLPEWLRLADLNVAYTLSRSVGNVSGAVASNPLDFDADFGYNAADARHNFTFSAVYKLWEALGMTENEGRSSYVWGWKISPTLNARSGLPLVVRLDRPDVVYVDGGGSVFSSPAAGRRPFVNTPGGGESAGTRVPDLRPGVSPYLGGRMELLNPEAFAIPAPGTFGNLRRGQLRGPARAQFDLSVTRYLYNREAVTAELRVDFFNLFNRANFSNPAVSLPNALGTSALDNQLQPGAAFTKASAGSFGVVSAAEAGRLIQFSFTLRFNGGFTK